ncbi:hypothetical protein BDZ45DRAFT_721916 [Acephala macrosclerotiorum]|nr:hypothetical protein BDZ45DRAFT_721916 [Acephala macrosclerotiorum]
MSSRNPGIPLRVEFHLFKKLPIELRQAIWLLNLESRVAEALWCERTKGDGYSENVDATESDREESPSDDIQFFSHTPLPAALIVCHDSRAAVLPFYPLCFASKSSDPHVRFNFSLDTLQLAQDYDKDATGARAFVELMANMTPLETSRLERLAIPSYLSFETGEYATLEEHWDMMGRLYFDKLTAIKEILAVSDASIYLNDTPWGSDAAVITALQRWEELCSNYREIGMEFCLDFPEELVRHRRDTGQYVPTERCKVYPKDWIRRKAKAVWGFRRNKYIQWTV